MPAAKKYRNAITFTPRNSTRIRVRQKGMSFSGTVNEDLGMYYDLIDCMSIEMRDFFTPQKWGYYCDILRNAEICKHTPWVYSHEIGCALETGIVDDLDTKWGVNAGVLAQEARELSILEAVWVWDQVQKGLENGYQRS